MKTKRAGVSTIATKMLSDLNRRFQFICNPEAQDFDPLYVTSTFLTLPYRGLLEPSQVLEAKMFLTCEMKRASNYDDDEHDGNNDHNDQLWKRNHLKNVLSISPESVKYWKRRKAMKIVEQVSI